MKIAEALMQRSDLQKRIGILIHRIEENSLIQEGDVPVENPKEVRVELDRCQDEHFNLIQRINRTNAKVQINGMSLLEILSLRREKKDRSATLKRLANSGMITMRRNNHNEIRFISTIDVKPLQEDSDRYARECREIDSTIQTINWTTELLD